MLATELQAGKGNSVLPFPCLQMSVSEGKKKDPGKTGAFFYTSSREGNQVRSESGEGRETTPDNANIRQV